MTSSASASHIVGTQAEKQQVSDLKDESMMDIYELSVPLVAPSVR
jgi:hypothetical protein